MVEPTGIGTCANHRAVHIDGMHTRASLDALLVSSLQEPSSTKSAWYTPPTGSSPSCLQPHTPPQRQSHSRLGRSSSQSSHCSMAALFSQQPDRHQLTDQPTTNSVATSSLMNIVNGMIYRSEEPKSLISSTSQETSKDVCVTFGVGSSSSSSDCHYPKVLEHSLFKSSSMDSVSSRSLVKQQPDSLLRGERVSRSGNALSSSQIRFGHSNYANSSYHPKPVLDKGKSSSDRYVHQFKLYSTLVLALSLRMIVLQVV